jgi:pimeloyl-ACP methyl ester carboxylesterase
MDAPTKNGEDSGDSKKHAITLIVSHGNALDAAMFVPFGRRLRDTLNVNIVLYDYSGYGVSTGSASVRNVYADLEAVVDWCVDARGADPKRIVLYGQSIGSAPTCRYAAKAGEAHDAYALLDASRMPDANVGERKRAANEKKKQKQQGGSGAFGFFGTRDGDVPGRDDRDDPERVLDTRHEAAPSNRRRRARFADHVRLERHLGRESGMLRAGERLRRVRRVSESRARVEDTVPDAGRARHERRAGALQTRSGDPRGALFGVR